MILNSVINKEIDMTGGELMLSLGIWALVFVISVGVGFLTPGLLRMKGDRGMYSLLIGFMNNGFIGMPLIIAVYGTEALFFASLSNIPFNLILYTLGLVILQGSEGETKFDLKRAVNAPIIATLAAIIIFFAGVRVPQFIADTVEMVSDATAPISMMCVGLALGAVPLKDAFVHPKLYLLALSRNIVCPLLTWLALKGLVADSVMLGTLVILSACPSAVICTILGIEYGARLNRVLGGHSAFHGAVHADNTDYCVRFRACVIENPHREVWIFCAYLLSAEVNAVPCLGSGFFALLRMTQFLDCSFFCHSVA